MLHLPPKKIPRLFVKTFLAIKLFLILILILILIASLTSITVFSCAHIKIVFKGLLRR